MEKYDRMIARNKQRNEEKLNRALSTMKDMLDKDEQIVVCSLVRKTGLSRAFFYRNEVAHRELVRLQELQEGKLFVAPQKAALDKAMEKQIEILKRQLAQKDERIAELQVEITRLKKTATAKMISTIKEL